MKHATEDTLSALTSFLDEIRGLPDLKEKKLGIFYRKSKAFLHFHEDPAGLFADIRLGGADFDRYPVNTRAEQKKLLSATKKFLRE